MHSLIESYYSNKISKEDLILKYYLEFSTRVKGARPPETTLQKYMSSGSNYLKAIKPFDYEIIDIERRVDFKIGKHPFVGYIDYIGRKDGEYCIIDHKSRDLRQRSRRAKPTGKDRELDEALRQLYIYSAAIKQSFGVLPKELCFNCFRTGRFIVEPFKMEKYEETIEWVNKSIERIENAEDFPPNLTFFGCRYICDVEDECIYREMEVRS